MVRVSVRGLLQMVDNAMNWLLKYYAGIKIYLY